MFPPWFTVGASFFSAVNVDNPSFLGIVLILLNFGTGAFVALTTYRIGKLEKALEAFKREVRQAFGARRFPPDPPSIPPIL